MKNAAWRAPGIFLLPFTAPGGEATNDLLPPRAELPPAWWEQHGWAAVIAGMAGVMAVALLIAVLCRRKPPVVTPPGELARVKLEALRGSAEDGALLVKVSGILRQYVLYVAGLPPAELTTVELRRAIESCPHFDSGLAAAINDFFRQCDERKFAPTPPSPPPVPSARPAGAVAAALVLMDQIERSRRQPAAAPPPPTAATP